ncbi:MAG: M48 family metallopeptidase [Vibrio sp.]
MFDFIHRLNRLSNAANTLRQHPAQSASSRLTLLTKLKLKPLLVVGLSAATLSACTSSPMGRSQVLLMSDQEIAQMGVQSFAEIKKSEKISTNSRTNKYVQCVANAITKYVPPQPGFTDWEVVVFDSDSVNAFALPGGKIGVYTGLLNVAKNQDQLATVIGHEIAHVLANHSNEQVSRSQMASAGMGISNIFLSGSAYQGAAMEAIGMGVQYGILLPFGRAQESEADLLGLELMSKAGFDPNQSVDLWQNMAKASTGSPPELLSTHPSHSTRIQDLEAYIQQLPKSTTPHPSCKA